VQATRRRQDAIRLPNWLFHIKRRVSSLRCGPRRRSFATMLLIRCHDFARPDPCRVEWPVDRRAPQDVRSKLRG